MSNLESPKSKENNARNCELDEIVDRSYYFGILMVCLFFPDF